MNGIIDDMWSEDPNEAMRELMDELEKMLVLGYVKIVGKNDQGEDLYSVTDDGVKYLNSMRPIADSFLLEAGEEESI